MTDKELLLSKLYDDNTICYWVNPQNIYITNQENQCISDWTLTSKYFWVISNKLWGVFEEKYKIPEKEIWKLVNFILKDHLKRNIIIPISDD